MINNCRQRNRKRRAGRAFDKIKFYQHRECGCTNADNADSDQDGPPDLDLTPPNSDNDDDERPELHPSSGSESDHESDVDSQSQVERDVDAPLGPSHITTAQDFVRETLLPTNLEVTAIKFMRDMRLQHQATADNANISNPHGSIDESRVSTDDGSRGGSST